MNKYKTGQKLYFKNCSKEYQKNNIFIPKYIERKEIEIQSEEGNYTIKYYIYSENGFSWYPENTLEEIDNES